jgi:hypothetical protein
MLSAFGIAQGEGRTAEGIHQTVTGGLIGKWTVENPICDVLGDVNQYWVGIRADVGS